ncbi:streptophobe family protein [Streptomyces sp. CAU 1734]|uniref:streptophobe family protein n=1 Tax=Streptomyces sp. CAU 1734 TaxID=3140360 RepID=UPI003261C567
MSSPQPPARARAPHGWLQALVAVAAAVVAAAVTAALGVWAAGAGGLPGGAYPRVVAAVMVLAFGGSVDLSGDAGPLGETRAVLHVRPLSVTLAAALALARGFLRPLRHRAVTAGRELLGWAARTAALWTLVLIALAAYARQTFAIEPGGVVSDIGELFGTTPHAGFRADVPRTLFLGLVWVAILLLLSLVVSRGAPLPARLLRFQAPVRPAAYAMVVLLLGCVAVGVIAGLVVAATRGHPAETFAVILLGVPNLVWLALTLGLGASWDGTAEGPFGLPMPRLLDLVVRTPGGGTLNLRTLAEHDARVWWLLAGAAVLVLGAAVLMAVRSPASMPAWEHAARMAVALTLTVLVICLIVPVDASFGLSLLGIGDLGGALGAKVALTPHLWPALGLALVWGAVTGFLGALIAGPVRRRGEAGARGQ